MPGSRVAGATTRQADLVLRFSHDRRQTWSDDRIVVRRTGGLNVMSPSLLRLNTGASAGSVFWRRRHTPAGIGLKINFHWADSAKTRPECQF